MESREEKDWYRLSLLCRRVPGKIGGRTAQGRGISSTGSVGTKIGGAVEKGAIRTWNYKKCFGLPWQGLGIEDALASLPGDVGWVSVASLSSQH